MVALAVFVIGLSGYWSFVRKRDGSHSIRSIGEAVLVAAMFLLLGGAMLWLFGAGPWVSTEDTAKTMELAFATALLGAFGASLRPLRQPLPHW